MTFLWLGLQLRRWLRLDDESGQGMVEYGLIIALIAVALIAALTSMNGSLGNVFNRITSQMNTAAS